ncbi:MAG: hypothetical protein IPH44_39065 [Myxococcales bacterium]|nr:hypothetical protein [Myxococcales bacterium]MBK7198960.1 hypothetical protein [Myxococcales bacterium]MBP6847612.1 hypothetical protein [Kofleriaceae bacterium]
MRTSAIARPLLAVLLAATAARADPPDECATAPARFTIAVPAEVTVVGLTYGLRPEVAYRPGALGSASRLRLAVGVLDGPDQLFVPLSLGYRAMFRGRQRVQPAVGAGVELQHRLVSDYPAVRQYGVYVEVGVGIAATPRLAFGLMVAIDVMLYGGPGAGLGPRVFASWRL